MAVLARLCAALAVLASSAAGSREEVVTSLASQTSACVDTDNGATTAEGWSCDMFDHPDKCAAYANSYNEYFNANTMCCTCGGGSSAQTSTPCPATCFGWTCDDWIGNGGGNTCESLEAQNGCQCSGCTKCEATASTQQQLDGFQGMGLGLCAREDGSEPAYKSHKYTDVPRCAKICQSSATCKGFASDDMMCFEYSDSGLKATLSGGLGDYTQCWAKNGHAAVEESTGGAAGAGAEANNNNFLTVPVPDTQADQTTQVIAVDATDQLGAVNDLYAQTFTFTQEGIYTLKTIVQPAETCSDTDPSKCTESATGEACRDNPNVQAECRRSCGLCGASQNIGLDIVEVVKSTEGFYRVLMGGQQGGGIKGLILAHPFEVKHKTWIVKGEDGEVLYTIQRRAHKQDCRYLVLDCKSVWKIYRGDKKDKKLINYGIQHQTSFKFYKSRSDFKSGTAPWLATYQKLLPTKENGDSLYKVTVKPGEDAALFLLGAFAVFKGGDMVKVKPGSVSD